MSVTFGSLFAGIGGFDLGFERAGMKCKWQVEIDDYATKVLKKNFPTAHREKDIRQCGRHNLQPVDVICGGFPCQDISYAGLGAGLEGERSGLFFEAVRVVRELRPKAVVLENVAALLTRGLDVVLGTLAAIGYDTEWHCIPAAAVGAPHIRDRVFVIGYAVADAKCHRLEGADDQIERQGTSTLRRRSADTSHAVADAGCERPRGSKAVDWHAAIRHERIKNTTGGGWWETEPDVGRVANGIPAWVDRLRGLGNSVVPQVAEFVAGIVLEKIQ